MNENENLQPVEKLTPFTRMVMSIGTLPSSFYASMSYYESMVWLYEYLKNEVIPAVNNNGEAVEELQGKFLELNEAFNTLENYIDTYFENLDVQQEINNKLDAMALDGTLTNLIKEYIDPLYQAYETQINGEISSFKTSVNNRLAEQDTQIQAVESGSPLVATSTSGMTDTTRVYVNTTDGNWYYYDGDSWEIGGTYQSSGISENAVDTENLSTFLQGHVKAKIPSYTTTTGSYINYQNQTSSSGNFLQTSPIQLLKGETITARVQGYTTQVSLVTLCESDGTNLFSVVRSTNSDETTTSYTAVQNCYVIISSHKDHFGDVKIYSNLTSTSSDNINVQNISNILQEQIKIRDIDYTITGGEYIDTTGNSTSSYSFFYTSPIRLYKNETIHARLTGYNGRVAILSTCDSSGTNIEPEIIPADDTPVDITYTANEDTYVILSTNKSDYNIKYINKELSTEVRTYDTLNDIKGIFSNAVFCGDSLTYGSTYISDTSPTSYQNYYNYPYYLNKLMNFDTKEEYALPGASATTWWSNFQNNIVSNNCVYFVWLGTNSIFTDSVDTDCAGNDYTTYANNETGNMGRILGKIKSLTNTKIVLLNCYAGGTAENIANTNKVLNDFATKFNCTKIDLFDSDITESKYHIAYNNYYNKSHLNNCGYNHVADIVYNTLKIKYNDNPQSYETYKVHN